MYRPSKILYGLDDLAAKNYISPLENTRSAFRIIHIPFPLIFRINTPGIVTMATYSPSSEKMEAADAQHVEGQRMMSEVEEVMLNHENLSYGASGVKGVI